jgi:hypothetical protein
MRQNHKLERDLAKLDKRIALLIKNRTSLQEVLATSRKLKSQNKGGTDQSQMDAKKLEVKKSKNFSATTKSAYLNILFPFLFFIFFLGCRITKIYSTYYKPNLDIWLVVCT